MKVSKILKAVVTPIFPFAGLISANREIQKEIDSSKGILEHISNSDKIETSILRKRYEETFSVKDKFEDKAKSQIFAITVAITVIFGASSLLKNISDKYSLDWVNWITFTLYVAATMFFIIAGILAIRLLMHENQVSTISLQSYMNDTELREQYDIATTTNIYRNIKRNNYVFTSYQCIRNAFICLLIVLIIAIIPIMSSSKSNVTSLPVRAQILYSSEANIYLISNNNQNDVEKAIADAESNAIFDDGKTAGFIDDNQQLFIQAKKTANKYMFYIFSITYIRKPFSTIELNKSTDYL